MSVRRRWPLSNPLARVHVFHQPKALLHLRVFEVVRYGAVRGFHADEWLAVTRLKGHAWKAIAVVAFSSTLHVRDNDEKMIWPLCSLCYLATTRSAPCVPATWCLLDEGLLALCVCVTMRVINFTRESNDCVRRLSTCYQHDTHTPTPTYIHMHPHKNDLVFGI